MSDTKPKITIDAAATPSEAIVHAAKKVVVVTDELGRALKVRKLNALNKVDLAMMVGPAGCANEAVIGPCAIAFSVTEIDGEAVFPPASYSELRALILRLDEEGLQAATLAHVEHFHVAPVEILGEAGEAVKNS